MVLYLVFFTDNVASRHVYLNYNIIHTTWIRGNPLLCGFVGTSFHAPRNCGMAYPRQCFPVDMTWVPSNSASMSTLNSGNAPVAPLVLYGVVGGGSHLPSGDSNVRLPCLFHKKKYNLLYILYIIIILF